MNDPPLYVIWHLNEGFQICNTDSNLENVFLEFIALYSAAPSSDTVIRCESVYVVPMMTVAMVISHLTSAADEERVLHSWLIWLDNKVWVCSPYDDCCHGDQSSDFSCRWGGSAPQLTDLIG